MSFIILTVAQATELLPLASQHLCRMQHQQTLSEQMGLSEDWGVEEWEAIVEALQGPVLNEVHRVR